MSTKQKINKKIKQRGNVPARPNLLLNELLGVAPYQVLAGNRYSPEFKHFEVVADEVRFEEGIILYTFKENELPTRSGLSGLNRTLQSAKKSLLGYEQLPKAKFGVLSVKCPLKHDELLAKATSVLVPMGQLKKIDQKEWVSGFTFYIGYEFNSEQRFAKMYLDIRLHPWSNELCDWADKLHSIALKTQFNSK